jgi:hypothetical protein
MRHFIILFVITLSFSLSVVSNIRAQFADNTEQKRIWSVGIEGSYLRNTQSGGFRTNCNCGPYKDGTGNTSLLDMFGEYQLSKNVTLGLRSGLDSKLITSSIILKEDAAVNVTHGNTDTVIYLIGFPLNSTTEMKLSYYFFSPYIKVFPFTEGVFFAAGAQFGFLTSSNLRYWRSIIPLDSFPGIHFPDGKNYETLQDGPVAGVRTLRVSALLSAGYELEVFPSFSTIVTAAYDIPFNDVSTDSKISGTKISSLLLTLGLKYGL